LICGGDIDTHGNRFGVNGSVQAGSISSGDLVMSTNSSSLSCSGSVTTNGKNFEPKGNVDIGGDLDCGYLPLGSNTTFKVDGEFRSTQVNVEWNMNGTLVVIDLLPDAINHSVPDTNKLIEKLAEYGAYHAVVKSSWTGAVDRDWFNPENWLTTKGEKAIPDGYTDVTIDNTVTNMPVVGQRNPLEVAVARNIFVDNTTDDVNLTIDNGGVLSTKFVYVKDSARSSAIVIKHRFDNMASFRVETGDVLVGSATSKTSEVYKKVKIERELQTGVAYYMGSATIQGTFDGVQNVLDGGKDEIYSYNTSDQAYTSTRSLSGSIYKGGSVYLYWYGNVLNRTIDQIGQIMNSEAPVTVPLELYEDGEFGWNMLSNPYQYSFPLSAGDQFDRGGVGFVAFRRFNRTTKKYESVTYSFDTDVTVPEGVDKYIAPQQAFFIKAEQESYFVFKPTGVAKGTDTPVKSSTLKSVKSTNDVLYMSLRGNVSSKGEDQTALVFRNGGSLVKNDIDADKKMENGFNNNLYILKGDGEFAIGLYPEVGEIGDEMLPLGYIVAKGSTEATIKAVNIDAFDAETDVYLCDLLNNEMYDLRKNDSYTFDVDAETESGVRIDDRFAIALKANKSAEGEVPTAVGEACKSVVSISAAQGGVNVSIIGFDGDADVCVYDVAGRVVSRENASQGVNKIGVAAKGVYVVEVVAGSTTKKAKVMVK